MPLEKQVKILKVALTISNVIIICITIFMIYVLYLIHNWEPCYETFHWIQITANVLISLGQILSCSVSNIILISEMALSVCVYDRLCTFTVAQPYLKTNRLSIDCQLTPNIFAADDVFAGFLSLQQSSSRCYSQQLLSFLEQRAIKHLVNWSLFCIFRLLIKKKYFYKD